MAKQQKQLLQRAFERSRASAFWLLFIAIKSNSPKAKQLPQGKERASENHPQDKCPQLAQTSN